MAIPIELQEDGARAFYRAQTAMNRETVSGPGSFMRATEEARAWLPSFVSHFQVSTLADIPCGDHHWLSRVELPCNYVGYDVLPELIEANRAKYPHRTFGILNAIRDVPERCTAILCRDFLVHLCFEHIQAVLANFRKSGAIYLLATHFDGIGNKELSPRCPATRHDGWGWRPLNMQAEPISLGQPISGVREIVAGEQWQRWLNVYRIN